MHPGFAVAFPSAIVIICANITMDKPFMVKIQLPKNTSVHLIVLDISSTKAICPAIVFGEEGGWSLDQQMCSSSC